MRYFTKLTLSVALLFNPLFLCSAENQFTEILTLDELISPADIIVIGEIESIITEGEFHGYNEDGSLEKPDPENFIPGLPAIDYSIRVDEVLSDKENLYKNENLTLRLMGSTSEDSFAEAYESLKGSSIFFLGQNPDKNTFGLRTLKHIIHIDEEKPRYHSYKEDGRFYLFENDALIDISTSEFESKLVRALQE